MIHPRQGYSNAEVHQAVAEVAAQIDQDDPVGVLYFASSDYDERVLAQEMSRRFDCLTWGCSSAGVFGSAGYHATGLQAVSLAGSARIKPFYCERLEDMEAIRVIADGFGQAQDNAFALMLLDGLSCQEEQFVHHLYTLSGRVPLVGGSSGGKLDFQHTWLASGETVHNGGGLVLLFETDVPIRLLKFENAKRSEKRFVVTRSQPEKRIVQQINGKLAAPEYARILGVAGDLSLQDAARHPWVLDLGGQSYLRAIREVRADGSLSLYCGVEEGLILSAGFPLDPIAAAEQSFSEARRQQGDSSLVLGFDCVLRRLELEQSGLIEAMGEVFRRENTVGFNTFGEQLQAIHMNQTFTGVALGGMEQR